ncbi:MAG: hypothetical protein OCD76_17965 [Reichenbachiella sp.]
MSSITGLSDASTMEQYRVALENVSANQTISEALGELGFGKKEIEQGKKILTDARTAYDQNNVEDDEAAQAYKDFSNLKEDLKSTYTLHRKKAKVVFRKDLTLLDQLALTGSLPQAYIKWLETVKKFYSTSNDSKPIQDKLKRLKISDVNITEALAHVAKLESARSEYLLEKGESQDSTKAKDQAISEIDDWMTEFYSVAKIALEDQPQLLEVLGKVVR